MHVHVFQHVPFEGLGSIAAWLKDQGACVTSTRFFAGDPLPLARSVDLLIALGGPMSVNNETEFPWLRDERRFVHEAIAAGIPVLGVCLGAQLIASALGARVYPNTVKEIGWFPIQSVPVPPWAFTFPPEALAFHWHGETFDLPDGAWRLASSKACENQAFQLGRHVIGLQFHLETTRESLRLLVEHCRDELVEGVQVQSERHLLATDATCFGAINELMKEVLCYLDAPQNRAASA
jgi:GMP synthase-like glutamine amidotransferase